MTTLNTNTMVHFDKGHHTYTLSDGTTLSGITSMLHRQMFKDMYQNIPSHVLETAAIRGDTIHTSIELYDWMNADSQLPEVQHYANLKETHGFTTLSNEYLVSNNTTHASCIDVVWENKEGQIVLADIKTTSKIHDDYLKWQLSIYAYLFELQNPHLSVHKMACIWLPKPEYGQPSLRYFDRIPSETIIQLLQCDALGQEFQPPTPPEIHESLPSTFLESEKKLVSILSTIKKFNELAESIKAQMTATMEQHNMKRYESKHLTISYTAPSRRTTVDSNKLKTQFPEVYNACTRQTEVKPSIRFTIK